MVIRGPDGLRLTPIGEQVLPLIEDVERAVSAVRDVVASRRAHIRLAVPSGFVKLLAAELADFGSARSDLSIELISGARAVDIEAGQADIAVRSGPIANKQLIVRAIGDTGFSLYAADSYLAKHPGAIDPGDLRGHSLLGYAPSMAGLPPAAWIEAHAAGATIALRSREVSDMVSAAVSGGGIAVLPCLLADVEPGLRRLTDQVVAKSRLSLVYPRETRLSEPLRTVIRWLLSALEKHTALIRGER